MPGDIRTTGFVTTARADEMTGAEFFRRVFGSSPERRARQDEEARKTAAVIEAKQRREILAMRERMVALLSPENAAKAREEWALQDRIVDELSFTMELQRKDAA